MWRGEVACREKLVNCVMQMARVRPSERMVLPTEAATDVNVVDETMMMRELRAGRMGERREARHLM